MLIRKRRWLLLGVAAKGSLAALIALAPVVLGGSVEAMAAPAATTLAEKASCQFSLRLAGVTPGPLAVLRPGESSPRAEEAQGADRSPAEPVVPMPDRAPAPGQGKGPLPGGGAMPGAGPKQAMPGDLDAQALFADPEARVQMLDQLYDALSTSPDPQAAGRMQQAIEKIWLRTGSPTVDLLLERAILVGQEGDYDLALEILNAAISLSPGTAEVWHQRAMVYFLREQHAEALSDLRQTLALDPKHYQAISGLGRVLQHLGQKESALAVFRRALEINPYLEPARLAVEELSREVEGQDI